MIKLDDVIRQLNGKQIDIVEHDKDFDCSLIIKFTDGTSLQFLYSSCEGRTMFNHQVIEELE